jgi:hypothetical protein
MHDVHKRNLFTNDSKKRETTKPQKMNREIEMMMKQFTYGRIYNEVQQARKQTNRTHHRWTLDRFEMAVFMSDAVISFEP